MNTLTIENLNKILGKSWQNSKCIQYTETVNEYIIEVRDLFSGLSHSFILQRENFGGGWLLYYDKFQPHIMTTADFKDPLAILRACSRFLD